MAANLIWPSRYPGKEEFYETIRYFQRMIEVNNVKLCLNTRVTAKQLTNELFDHVVIATGIEPRVPEVEGIHGANVVSYIDVIKGKNALGENIEVGQRVAIMGAGGIGFDVAELITHHGVSAALDINVFAREWGVDFINHPRGGVTGVEPQEESADREVYLLQRKSTPVGRGLGKTTGWTHRMALGRRGVNMINGVTYEKIDSEGIHISIDNKPQFLAVDTVIRCTGQIPLRELYDDLQNVDIATSLIGGAFEANELDAKTAINQACYLASAI